MNVLFLTTHLNGGGITSYILTLAQGMCRKGLGVHVASSAGNRMVDFKSCGAHHLLLNIQTKSELSPKIYMALPELSRYVHQQAIDIIHTQTRVTQVMGTWLSIMTGRPHVTTCHGFFKRRLLRKLFPCWGKASIAISHAVADHLRCDWGVVEQGIQLIPSGIDLNQYVPITPAEKKEIRRKYNLGDSPIIGIIARLSEVKGQDILIEAMRTVVKEFATTKLLIVGRGKTEKSLQGLVKAAGLENQVFFYPVVHTTVAMLSMLDIFIMSSRQEGLGIAIMEAQAMGLPVIASKVGGIPSLIQDGKTGVLVEPEQPRALAKAIIGLLQDPNRREALGKAAREFIQRDHCATTMVNDTLALYTRMMETP